MYTTPLLAVLIFLLFVGGLAAGYLYSRGSETSMETKLRTVIAMIVTAMWVMAMVADIFLSGYVISPMVHAIMGAVVGYFFADTGLNINLGGKKNE